MYGLKQLGREWNDELNSRLTQDKFNQLLSDPCVYIRKTEYGIEIITIWVDNLLLFTNSKPQMTALKKELQTLFDVTDLSKLNKLVGIEITRDQANQSLTITQT